MPSVSVHQESELAISAPGGSWVSFPATADAKWFRAWLLAFPAAGGNCEMAHNYFVDEIRMAPSGALLICLRSNGPPGWTQWSHCLNEPRPNRQRSQNHLGVLMIQNNLQLTLMEARRCSMLHAGSFRCFYCSPLSLRGSLYPCFSPFLFPLLLDACCWMLAA